MAGWHTDEDFWRIFSPLMFGQKSWACVPEEVDQLLELLPIPAGARVLDMACGPGRHALELARRGYRVTGVDSTPVLLEEARRRAAAEALEIVFRLEDMRTFHQPGAFDAAINMYTAFGYFEDPAENQQALTNLAEALVPGGQLLMELAGKEVVARIFQKHNWTEIDGDFFLVERSLNEDWSLMVLRWMRFSAEANHNYSLAEYAVRHWLYSAVELKAMLSKAGFTQVQVYGSLGGIPYDEHAQRLVLVAAKV